MTKAIIFYLYLILLIFQVSYNYAQLKQFEYENIDNNQTAYDSKRIALKSGNDKDKFQSIYNQEDSAESGKTLGIRRRKRLNPCLRFGRNGRSINSYANEAEGRFLWDIDIYNVFPYMSLGCGGYYRRPLLRDGILQDSVSAQFNAAINGLLQNSLAVTTRPQYSYQRDNFQYQIPNQFQQTMQYPIQHPHQLLYNSAGAPPFTLAQLVSGISTTVNGIIQQLAGTVQPVYPTFG